MNMAEYEHARQRFATPYPAPRVSEQVREFLTAVYSWMCAGLAITAVTAWLVAGSPATGRGDCDQPPGVLGARHRAARHRVRALGAGARLAPATASLLFVVYSALTGVTLSFVLLVYTGDSVAATFVVTAGMFGALALYGTTTRRSSRARPVSVHGPDRRRARLDRRHLLAQ